MPISSNTPSEKSNVRETRERELIQEARAAFDSAGFSDRDFRAGDGGQCWVAAILTPGAQSGAATDELIVPEGASAAMIVEGASRPKEMQRNCSCRSQQSL